MKLLQGDNLPLLKLMEDNSVDAVVTDPPYGLSFMGKKWDYDVPSKELWEEVLRVLKPGGHLLSFCGTRTYHRMAVNIEDAGFEIRDMIEWVYGSGFPKSHNIGKAVDKLQGNEREAIPDPEAGRRNKTVSKFADTYGDIKDKTDFVTKGTSEWEGWGTATKPAHEPIAFCTKPLTLELIFAKMGIDITNEILNLCQKYNVNVNDVEQALNSIHLKLEKVGVNTVAENARTCDWENIESAVIVALNFMSQKHTLKEKIEESREVSAQINARENGNSDLLEKTIQIGKVDNLREQMATLQNMLATETIGLNTILLWKQVLEDVLEKAKMSTISTALEMTTGLKICNSLLKVNTQDYTRANEIRPNHEPICMARKPLAEKTVAENVLKYGTGGINIDESRVEYQSEADKSSATPQGKCTSNTSAGSAPDVDMSEVDYNGEKYWYKNEYKWLIDKWLNDEDYVWSELKENLETYNWCKVPEIDNGDRVLFDSQEGVCVRLYESKRKEFERPDQLGRFPANIIHDNSEEVRECFPETNPSKKAARGGTNPNPMDWGNGRTDGGIEKGHDDNGGNASRFFKSIMTDSLCTLCCLPFDIKHDTMSVCNNTNVNNAEKSSEATQATTEVTAPRNATTPDSKKFVQSVRSVANLCDLCGTYIALVLAGGKPVRQEEEARGQIFITKHKKQILDNALASFVELRGKKDTTPTINNLNLLFGYVFNAIENSTIYYEQEKEEGKIHEWKSLLYQAKASKRDRGEGNNHPTVKPVALMEYLIEMVTPKGGTVLDPYMGSGTTGIACKQKGFDFIGMEMDAEYCKIAEARIHNTPAQQTLI